MNVVRFDEAMSIARVSIVDALKIKPEATPPILIRGVTGRLRLYRKDPSSPFDDAWAESLRAQLGAFADDPEDFILRPEDFFDVAVIENAEDIQDISETGPCVKLLDRLPHGEDWLRPLRPETASRPRAVLFGIKGGVGRSTALAIWAWWLARRGKRVLVVDLDIESPGLGSILLPLDGVPRFGLVDVLMEDVVGQADTDLIEQLSVESPLSTSLDGRIHVVSAFGSETEWYTSKLLRATLDLPHGDHEEDRSFASRLDRVLRCVENHVEPDIVLLDSRAGMHDLAAVALTRLGAKGFLFAADTPQTWKAYEILFSTWRRHRQIGDLRQRLQMVAATVPPTERDTYLDAFRQQCWDLWLTLYDASDDADYDADYDADASPSDFDKFTFDLYAEDAPHWPLLIDWDDRLRFFDPVNRPEALNPAYIEAAFGDFLKKATRLILGDAEENLEDAC